LAVLLVQYNRLMPMLKGLEGIVAELREERKYLVNNLRHVDAALSVLGKLEGGKFATESPRVSAVSAASRRKMALAQKARWAKIRNSSASGSNNGTRKRKPMSAAIKAKLRAAYAANHPGWKPKKK